MSDSKEINRKWGFRHYRGNWYLLPFEKLETFEKRRDEIDNEFPKIDVQARMTNKLFSDFQKYEVNMIEGYIFENPVTFRINFTADGIKL